MSKVVQPPGNSSFAISNRSRRSLLFQEAQGKCFYCGDPVFEARCQHPRDWLVVKSGSSKMVREHKIPTVRDGSDDIANVACACGACNASKGSFTLDEFRIVMALRRGDLNFRFPGENSIAAKRDWLVCHTPAFERDLVVHNMPTAIAAYGLRNGWARGPKGRRT